MNQREGRGLALATQPTREEAGVIIRGSGCLVCTPSPQVEPSASSQVQVPPGRNSDARRADQAEGSSLPATLLLPGLQGPAWLQPHTSPPPTPWAPRWRGLRGGGGRRGQCPRPPPRRGHGLPGTHVGLLLQVHRRVGAPVIAFPSLRRRGEIGSGFFLGGIPPLS